MYEEELQKLGLTRNETSVYLALLKVGKAKSGEIIRVAKVSGGKIYETLYKLVDKGLVKEVIENGVKNFIASSPKALVEYTVEKENSLKNAREKVENIIPALENFAKLGVKSETVSLIKGFRGITSVVYNILRNSEEIKIMGIRSTKNIKFNNFWKNWHRTRISLKKNTQIIFSDKNTEYWKFFKSLPFTQVKSILSFSPSAIMIIDDNSFLFSYNEEFTCIHIASASISNSLSSFFDSMWKIAES